MRRAIRFSRVSPDTIKNPQWDCGADMDARGIKWTGFTRMKRDEVRRKQSFLIRVHPVHLRLNFILSLSAMTYRKLLHLLLALVALMTAALWVLSCRTYNSLDWHLPPGRGTASTTLYLGSILLEKTPKDDNPGFQFYHYSTSDTYLELDDGTRGPMGKFGMGWIPYDDISTGLTTQFRLEFPVWVLGLLCGGTAFVFCGLMEKRSARLKEKQLASQAADAMPN